MESGYRERDFEYRLQDLQAKEFACTVQIKVN